MEAATKQSVTNRASRREISFWQDLQPISGGDSAMMSPPWRSYDPNLIQEPTIYRLNEAVMHLGESIKEIINEDFGDGIMSAIDFYCSVDKIKGVDGNKRVVVTLDGKYLSHSEHRKENMVSRLNLRGSKSE
ncbi:unnamed protein product [Arabis nemorensis]|uniref:Cyanate lyase C-terminal domain-containing protein n=1 Tax=Arabis nemorensis TaxID=586526 RepID=A0A565BPC4_9BRAS|nr:unnamed protein product [Arabis nemorensis]